MDRIPKVGVAREALAVVPAVVLEVEMSASAEKLAGNGRGALEAHRLQFAERVHGDE